jgi:hypothetical protein
MRHPVCNGYSHYVFVEKKTDIQTSSVEIYIVNYKLKDETLFT